MFSCLFICKFFMSSVQQVLGDNGEILRLASALLVVAYSVVSTRLSDCRRPECSSCRSSGAMI